MVDIDALMRVLPISSLKPHAVACLYGLGNSADPSEGREHVVLLEPPAGCSPFLDPRRTLEILLQGHGLPPWEARAHALTAMATLEARVPERRRVHFLDDSNPDSPACVSVPDFVSWLRYEDARALRLRSDVIDFVEDAALLCARTPIFRGPENLCPPDPALSLLGLPELPPPKAMIEFVPGAPWADHDAWGDWKTTNNPFIRWRDAIHKVAGMLERALGEPVYRFADLDDEYDDDDVHRFLMLQWCCVWKPESAFVRYLLRVTGAPDAEALAAALVDPASYRYPFEMNDASVGLYAQPCRFEYWGDEREWCPSGPCAYASIHESDSTGLTS